MKLFEDSETKVCIAVSPQSLSSLTQYCRSNGKDDQNDLDTFRKLQSVFYKLGAHICLDMSMFVSLSLALSYHEFK